ncbi:hypothetical protein GGTG_12244 [Gaeumannomyces tritici R3-111a-1]|uniref:Uncharacterized protein n=1 Tax=Gaeumannomyces tritici (strain R3-111a-1) TaxID=644352 RepID=J3PFG9_GAET3|nr:hypothetical protein GGTG_12244 [Gaeumannomyces tritici R3-111a-1]EJT70071.1 hypothetical protein GGTG_12244 [Gaeumannomyces tritici R3-111a-1]
MALRSTFVARQEKSRRCEIGRQQAVTNGSGLAGLKSTRERKAPGLAFSPAPAEILGRRGGG